MTDEYLTLEGPCEGLFKAKGSKHFGYGFPIQSEEEAKERLLEIRKAHHAARHMAYAWMLGYDGTQHRCSDDGEPNNSAGPPIFGVIRANNLTKVLFAVVRYFGGTKLGVGGLIEAYREGAAEALRNGTVVQRIRTERIRLEFAYEHMGTVMGMVKRLGLQPTTTDFSMACSLELDVRLRSLYDTVRAFEETRVATVSPSSEGLA